MSTDDKSDRLKLQILGNLNEIKDNSVHELIRFVESDHRDDFYGFMPPEKIAEDPFHFVILRSPDSSLKKEDLVGLLRAHIMWDWMKIETLWVRKDCRSHSVGRNLLQEAEELAKEKGLVGIQLNSWNKELVQFYEACGYSVAHTLNDHPRGHMMFCLIKKLA